jgi:mannose-6-phosphate isomerase-like protein (cupin superfamily)
MKRRQFLQLPLAAAALTSDAVPTAAQDAGKGLFVKAGADRDNKPFKWLDATFQVKLSGKDCGGRCVIFDTQRPEQVGPPLHLHNNCDEWFFVQEGDFKFQVGGETMRLTAGDSLLVPLNTPHAFVKTSEGTARLIVMHQPAATMEEYFRSVITIADQSVEGRRALGERHGMFIVGPALKAD